MATLSLEEQKKNLFTPEGLSSVASNMNLLLALTKEEIKGEYESFLVCALVDHLCKQKGSREYAVRHYGQIADLKPLCAVVLFDEGIRDKAIVDDLQKALKSDRLARQIRNFKGDSFEDFCNRVQEAAAKNLGTRQQ